MSLKLFLFLSIVQLCYSTSVQCPANSCASQSINCKAGQDCTINCKGTRSCNQATFNCPQDKQCNIECYGKESCRSAVMKCPSQGTCNINLLCHNDWEYTWNVCTGMSISGGSNINYGCNKGNKADGDCPVISGVGGPTTKPPTLGAICSSNNDCTAKWFTDQVSTCKSGSCVCNAGNCCFSWNYQGNDYTRCWGAAALEMGEDDAEVERKVPLHVIICVVVVCLVIVAIVGVVCYRKRKNKRVHREEIKDEDEEVHEIEMEEEQCITTTTN